MLTAIYVIASIIVFGLLASLLWFLIGAYRRQHGEQVITCPETGRPAVVEVDAVHMALTSIVRQPDMRLRDCSRWPVKQECGQECLLQIETASPECLVHGVLAKWYRNKRCVFCSRRFEVINWTDHKPALRDPERNLVEWRDVSADRVFEVLETHSPVCWNCFVAESFHRDYPELVVERPAKPSTHIGR